MKLKKELSNAILIFFGIGIYFLIMDLLGLSNLYYLRALNALIVMYGVSKTIKSNISEGKTTYLKNFASGMLTSVFAVVLSIIGLRIYVMFKGGKAYLEQLAEVIVFGKGASINDYSIGLLFEGIASSVIIVFITMHYWNSKFVAD
ncbi:MAG: hypothetical protein ACI7YS_04420 [Flavobacterium sp.]